MSEGKYMKQMKRKVRTSALASDLLNLCHSLIVVGSRGRLRPLSETRTYNLCVSMYRWNIPSKFRFLFRLVSRMKMEEVMAESQILNPAQTLHFKFTAL